MLKKKRASEAKARKRNGLLLSYIVQILRKEYTFALFDPASLITSRMPDLNA